MAVNTATQATAETNGKPKVARERKPSEYKQFVVFVHQSVDPQQVEPAAALEALAGARGYKSKLTHSDKTSVTRLWIDTAESAQKREGRRGRQPSLIDKDTRKQILGLYEAAMRNPETAERLQNALKSGDAAAITAVLGYSGPTE